MLDRLSLTPDGIVLVPRPRPLCVAAVSSAAMGAAIALLGLTAGAAIGGAVLLSAGAAAVIGRGFGPFTGYPDTRHARSRFWIAPGAGRSVAGGRRSTGAAGRSGIPRASPRRSRPPRCS